MAERLRDLTPLLRNGLRILEIGCAEGELGKRIKAMANVEYVGVELSADADSRCAGSRPRQPQGGRRISMMPPSTWFFRFMCSSIFPILEQKQNNGTAC